MSRIAFKGVIPPMITPFTADGAVDYDAHLRNLERWNTTGLGGYLVLGSNSEAIALSDQEKLKLIELTVKNAAPGRTILAGTGMESTVETIRLTNEAARLGAHAALLVTPFYYKESLNDEAMIHHFRKVADQADIPVMVYNVPKYTGVNLSNKVIAALSQHPNVIGMKDSTGNINQLVEFQRVAAPDYEILVGTAGVWYPALTLGVKAGIMALANCAPEACVNIQQLFLEGRQEEAESLYRKWVPVNNAVTATFGVAGLKYACTRLGYDGGYVRSPLMELGEAGKKAIDQLLEEV